MRRGVSERCWTDEPCPIWTRAFLNDSTINHKKVARTTVGESLQFFGETGWLVGCIHGWIWRIIFPQNKSQRLFCCLSKKSELHCSNHNSKSIMLKNLKNCYFPPIYNNSLNYNIFNYFQTDLCNLPFVIYGRIILRAHPCRLDSSESAREKIDEHVAKMWMACRRHYT